MMIRLRRGKVLKIKLGYNPNSSSIGSLITTFLWSSMLGLIAINFLLFKLFPPEKRKK